MASTDSPLGFIPAIRAVFVQPIEVEGIFAQSGLFGNIVIGICLRGQLPPLACAPSVISASEFLGWKLMMRLPALPLLAP